MVRASWGSGAARCAERLARAAIGEIRSSALSVLLRVGLGTAIFAALAAGNAARAAMPEKPNTSKATREAAIRAIPHDKLPEDARKKVSAVVEKVSIYRRLPTQVIECDPKLYLFLVEHPDLVVNIWEVLKVSNIALARLGPTSYRANDGAGTLGKVEFLYKSHDTHLLYADGAYDGPLFVKPVKGRCVLLLKTGYVQETNGKFYITCRLDAFIQLDNVGVEFVARTFQPLVGKTADHNFRETTNFLSVVSRTAEVNQPGLQDMIGKLDKVTHEERVEFSRLVAAAGERSADGSEAESLPPLPSSTAQRQLPNGTRER